MELALFAFVLAGIVLVVGREIVQPTCRISWAPSAIASAVLAGCLLASTLLRAAPADQDAAQGRVKAKPAVKKLVRAKGWPADHPLPLVGSNCAACH